MKQEKHLKVGSRVNLFIYWIAAAALLVVLCWLTFPVRAKDTIYEPQIVVLGDSIMGQVRDETSVSEQLSAMIGIEIFNGALGGTCLSRIDTERRIAYTKDSLSFAAISQAVMLEDFGPQQSTVVRENATEYFSEVIDDLEKIDFSKVDILLVQYGVNDYHAGIPMDNSQDPLDEYTFDGALRSAVTFWREKNPDIRIILLTPTYSWYDHDRLTCEEKDEGGGILEDYVNEEIRLAEELNVEIIDLYHDLYPHEGWEDEYVYTWDGLHLNEAGRWLMADAIAAYLNR